MALYAKGMTTRDIQEIVQELYGVEVLPMLVSQITADLDQEVTAWRNRRLDSVWPSRGTSLVSYVSDVIVYHQRRNQQAAKSHKKRKHRCLL